MKTHRLIALLLAAAPLAADTASAREESALRTRLSTFLEKHCLECHSGAIPEAGLDLATTSTDLDDAEVRRRWVHLYDRVAGGEMPPKSVERPDEAARASFLRTLGESLTAADLANREVVLRRLNRDEYEHTVRDLFGIEVDVQAVLSDDSVEQGFDTVASALSVSAEQMVAYVEAADLVLDQVFGPPSAPKRVDMTVNIRDLRSQSTADRVMPDGVVLFSGAKSLPLYGASSVAGPWTYRLRIEANAIQSDRPVVMQVYGGVTGRIPGHVAGFFEVPPDKVTTIEVLDRAVESSDTYAFGLVGGYPQWKVDGDAYTGPGLWLGNIHIEGPVEEWPPASRAKLLGDVDPVNGTIDDVRAVLSRLLPRAFRRSTEAMDVEPFVALAQRALDDDLSFENALRRGVKGVLCAPEFLFMEERLEPTPQDVHAAGGGRSGARIDDFALATRLSYFLWSSQPDRELLALAERGELKRPDVLRNQVERMLADPRSQRFIERFTGQWLRLDDVDFTVPDPLLYPEYDELLRRSMLDETRAFFREVLDRDHSVQDFVDSEWLTINEPLARFYEIDGVEGLAIRRVERPPGSVRGGVLTQASVLKVSADGTRTSPVLRGAWFLRHFLGTPSPPPPPTVKAVEPNIRGATTIREQLALHRDDESCNRCHRRIDPPGFALEGFDVIGAERDWYRTRGEGKIVKLLRHPQDTRQFVRYKQGQDVDASGTMEDGREFADVRDFKRLLSEDETLMARALTQQLMTYSLGRQPGFSDRPEVERIVANVRAAGGGLRSLVHEIVRSEAFRNP